MPPVSFAYIGLLALVAATPLLLFFNNLFVAGAIQLYVAIGITIIAIRIRPGEARHFEANLHTSSAWRDTAAVAVRPTPTPADRRSFPINLGQCCQRAQYLHVSQDQYRSWPHSYCPLLLRNDHRDCVRRGRRFDRAPTRRKIIVGTMQCHSCHMPDAFGQSVWWTYLPRQIECWWFACDHHDGEYNWSHFCLPPTPS